MSNNSEAHHSLSIPGALSWLRLLAVILVFTGHSPIRFGSGQGSVFFLVLSGYTFTRIFLREWSLTGTVNVSNFIKRRSSKIIPALYIVVFLNILIKWLFHKSINYSHVISVLTFTANYFNAFNDHPNSGFSHFWTVSMMMQFYILWPILFIFLMKKFRSQFQVTIYLLVLVISIIFYRSLMMLIHPESNAYIYNALETRFDSFIIGALFALNINHPYILRIKNFVTTFKWSILPSFLAIACMSILPLTFRNSIGFDLHSVLIGILIIQLSAFDHIFSYTTGMVFSTELLGEMTYWFYLMHPWGVFIGKFINANPYVQVTCGGIILLSLLVLLCFFKKITVRYIKYLSSDKMLGNFKLDKSYGIN